MTTPRRINRTLSGAAAVLVVSVVLNAVLLARVLSDRPTEPPQAPARVLPVPVRDSKIAAAALTDVTLPTKSLQWSDLWAEGLREYATNLYGMGCPSHVVRAVLADEIRSRYLPLLRELRRQSAGDYWDRSALVKTSKHLKRTPEANAAKERLDDVYRKFQSLQREFDVPDERDRFQDSDGDDVRIRFLSDEKQTRLRDQDQAVDQLRHQLRSERVPEDEIRRQVRDLETTQDAERREFLDPGEYEEYRLRTSPHSGLMGELFGFDPTPEERQKILNWRESIGDEVKEEDWATGLRPLLGDARFAEFQQARDPEYRDLVEMTAHFDLNETVANDIYAARQSAETAAGALRALDQTQPGQQLEDALAEVRAEAERTLRLKLGDAAFEVYARHAEWLKVFGNTPAAP